MGQVTRIRQYAVRGLMWLGLGDCGQDGNAAPVFFQKDEPCGARLLHKKTGHAAPVFSSQRSGNEESGSTAASVPELPYRILHPALEHLGSRKGRSGGGLYENFTTRRRKTRASAESPSLDM